MHACMHACMYVCMYHGERVGIRWVQIANAPDSSRTSRMPLKLTPALDLGRSNAAVVACPAWRSREESYVP